MSTRKLRPSSKRILINAPESGDLRSIPHPVALSFRQRGWGEIVGWGANHNPSEHGRSHFKLNEAGLATADQLRKEAAGDQS